MKQSTTKDPLASSADDHTEVVSLWNSDAMQKRLDEARVKRAKIIAARQAEISDLDGQQGGLVKAVSGVPAEVYVADDAIEVPLVRPVKPLSGGQKTLQLEHKKRRHSRASSLVAGMALGLTLGAGTMWISDNGLSGFSAAIDTFIRRTGDDAVAENQAVDSILPEKVVEDMAVPADPPEMIAPPVTSDEDRIATEEPADKIGRLMPSDPFSERQTMPLPEDQLATGRQVSSSSATNLPTNDQLQSDTFNQTDPPLSGGEPSQVILHVSPDVSRRVFDDVRSTIDTAGIDVKETSIAGFAVLESEVRFFHQSDAQAAQRIADEMRVKVRDFSTFRPTPERGTLEVWLAQGG